jgi:hypothetical protein
MDGLQVPLHVQLHDVPFVVLNWKGLLLKGFVVGRNKPDGSWFHECWVLVPSRQKHSTYTVLYYPCQRKNRHQVEEAKPARFVLILCDPESGLWLGHKQDSSTISLSERSVMLIAGANMLHGLRQQQPMQRNDVSQASTVCYQPNPFSMWHLSLCMSLFH